MNSLVRKWGEQVIRSRQYAAGVALVVAFFSFFDLPIGWLATVIIALVTLHNGPRQGLVVIAWAILPAVAMLCLGQYEIFVNVSFLHYLVVFALATMLRQKGWIYVIQLAALLGVMAVIGVHYLAPSLNTWLVNQLAILAKDYKTYSVFNLQPTDVDIYIKYIGLFATGLTALAVILANLTTLFIARWWQSSIVPLVSLQKECYVIRVNFMTSLLLGVLLLGICINSELFLNILIVALVPFVLSGLSLLHAWSANKKNGNVILFVFYMLFLFFSPYLVALLSVAGWLDSFINFRRKFVIDDAIQE